MGSASGVRARLLGAVIALTLLAGACGGDDDGGGAAEADGAGAATATTTTGDGPSGDSSGEGEAVDVDRSAELSFGMSFGTTSLDPHKATNPGWSIWMRPVYDRLLTLVRADDGSVEVGPQLATSWEVSDDGLELSMELRDDVKFWDGTPFTGEVVRANIQRAMSAESAVSSYLTAVKDVEVIDKTHVVFKLKEPYPALAYSLAADTIGMMVNPKAFDTDLATEPAGSGPYQLESFKLDAEVVYTRWDDHWDPDAALAETLRIVSVPDTNARLNAVRSGELDAAYQSQPADLQARDLDGDGFQWVQELAPITQGVMFNMDSPPFDDENVRKAVSMAIDREAIANELLGGLAPPVFQPFPEGYMGHDPELETDPYDPEAAKALFEEAGLIGEKVELLAIGTPPYDSIAQVVQQSLGDLGVEVEIVTATPTESIPTWREGGYGFYVGTILAEPEPSLTLSRSYLGGQGDAVGEPPDELVEMADEAAALPADGDARDAAYQEIGAYIKEHVIFAAPVVQFSTVILANDQVVNAEDISKVVIGKADLRGVGIAAS